MVRFRDEDQPRCNRGFVFQAQKTAHGGLLLNAKCSYRDQILQPCKMVFHVALSLINIGVTLHLYLRHCCGQILQLLHLDILPALKGGEDVNDSSFQLSQFGFESIHF